MGLIIAAIQPDTTRWIFVSGAIIALLIVVGGLGVWYYRKYVLFSDQTSSGGSLWTFDDLRQMKERGDLTEAEYQSLRAAMIGSLQGKPKEVAAPEDPPHISGHKEVDFDLEKGPEA